MLSPDILLPDFTVTETLANAGTLHMMRLGHRTPHTLAFVEAFKSLDPEQPEGMYSFGWQTNYTAQDALRVLVEANTLSGFDAQQGKISVVKPGETVELAWAPSMPTNTKTESDVSQAALLRLDAEGYGAIVWDSGIVVPRHVGIIATQAITSPWIAELVSRTASTETKEVIDRNVGNIALALSAFLATPFGEAFLEPDRTP